jgi:hypothetical protein
VGQGGIAYYKYPHYLGGDLLHWISFDSFEFSRGSGSGNQRLDVALYIPADALQTSYKSEYTASALGQIGGRSLEALQKSGNTTEGMKGILAAQAKSLASEGIATAVLSGAVGGETAKTILQQSTGKVVNPYIVAAYKGPSDMREHKFTFKFNPKDADESHTCVHLINAFKMAMLPSHSGGNERTSPAGLFSYPDEFVISYYINGNPLPQNRNNPMFNIGRSVLTACDMNYSTESVPLFFEGTQFPVSMEMGLTFMEIEVMHREKVSKAGY